MLKMSNPDYISIAKLELKHKHIDAYYMPISNENLYEFVSDYDNFVKVVSGFTGDTGSLLITQKNIYLVVDGRFELQAKKEIKDRRIKIVVLKGGNTYSDFLFDTLNKNTIFSFNPKTISIHKANMYIEVLKDKNITVKPILDFMHKEISQYRKKMFYLSSAPLFNLGNEYVSKMPKEKIKEALCDLEEKYYITSNQEEIAYITNLRYAFYDIGNSGVLFKSHMILSKNKNTLYIDDYLDGKAYKYIYDNNIIIKKYDAFYSDIKKIKKANLFLDPKMNNYYTYKLLNQKNVKLGTSPLKINMSIKGKREISCLKEINILDGIAITKAIYTIKEHFLHKKNSENNIQDEYKIARFVDKMRAIVGEKKFLTPSFETIVAMDSNSAICHYIPKKRNTKIVTHNSLLLIDSGGHYLGGSTDITRTISLYVDKIPSDIKKYYTLVLNSVLKFSKQKFVDGLTGSELDIIARQNLYNEYLDFNHGTGHGIGYISNIHEGPNRIGPGILANYDENVLYEGQVLSCEPGIYFENKYGIRIENDLLVRKSISNKFGDFLKFETLTLCPYDIDLIDEKYLDKDIVPFLNDYNRLVYKTLSRYLTKEESKWLKKYTKLF